MRLIVLMATIGATVFASADLLAKTLMPQKLNYETTYTPEAKDYIAPSLVSPRFEGRFTLGYLLGEPVVNCTARWNNGHQLLVNLPSGGVGTVNEGEAEVYSLNLIAQVWDPEKKSRLHGDRGGHLGVFCDAGIVAQSGRSGFNVAGSPNWDKLICELSSKFKIVESVVVQIDPKQNDDCLAVGGQWLSADEAKRRMRAGLKFEDVRVVSARFNVNETIRRYEKLAWRKKSFDYKVQKFLALESQLASRSPNGYSNYRKRVDTQNKKPSSDQLKSLDAILGKMQAELKNGDAFAQQWRERDKELVGGQLAYITKIDAELREAQFDLAIYRAELEKRAKNAPEINEPSDFLAPYLKATLQPFKEGPFADPSCGFKSADGKIIIPAQKGNYSCRRVNLSSLGIYWYVTANGRDQDRWRLRFIDNEGQELVNIKYVGLSSGQQGYFSPNIDALIPIEESGTILIKFFGADAAFFYSIRDQRLVRLPASSLFLVSNSATVVRRKGKMLVALSGKELECRGKYSNRAYVYLDLSSGREVDRSCTEPEKDAQNLVLRYRNKS